MLDGSVVAISPDAILNERTGESFYTVQVRTDEERAHGPQRPAAADRPGMVADVDLLGDKRTILQYILSPDHQAERNARSASNIRLFALGCCFLAIFST